MKPLITLSAVIALTACAPADNWDSAPQNYKCTTEQIEKAEREAKAALALTDKERYAAYWYGSAIMRNCTRRAQ